MHRNFRVARACGVEAAQDFQWHEYAPFAWILGAQLLFLLLALNLGSTIGMGTAGARTKRRVRSSRSMALSKAWRKSEGTRRGEKVR